MASVEKSIDVNVPVETAYNQWTQFESFPNFMEGVESVRQLDDRRLHWKAEIGGREEEWDADITEQIPDSRVAWTSISGAPNAGVVTFHRLSDDTCRVTLQIEYEPQGAVESLGDALGVVRRQVEGDLERFKEFIERQGVPSGAWRGEIGRPESQPAAVGAAVGTGTSPVDADEDPTLLT
ncbi:MAG TPA: SRPBCC family protein [Chloroflexota bacterium]|nr:SRPBCC family protein [Chloroflexota bacterium]